ncbi:MAG: agmatine deiminase family protein [Sulfurospirillum sp.]|nr:agmatine deiminase family protein [Sulfurospirillum sp.]
MAKRLPSEWEKQSALMVVFPTSQLDWQHSLAQIQASYVAFINAIITYQPCFVLCDDTLHVSSFFTKNKNLFFIDIQTNDTWIRDFGGIDFYENGSKKTYNFTFNAWGDKFMSNKDDAVTKQLFKRGILHGTLINESFVLEGGSIDSNGEGVILSTQKCLFNSNRNKHLTQTQITQKITSFFDAKKLIMLANGGLYGDDTDAHVDTLARFLDKETIAYVKCYDKNDAHFDDLEAMEQELSQTGFKLFPLPLPHAKFYNNHRLPATYLNFVFINDALIVPTYDDVHDASVLASLQLFFSQRVVIGIDAQIFIREHGSLHCSCMNIYEDNIL